jgi:hypothetical protein
LTPNAANATSEILKESEKALEEERRKADSEQTLGTSWIAIQHYLTKPTKIIYIKSSTKTLQDFEPSDGKRLVSVYKSSRWDLRSRMGMIDQFYQPYPRNRGSSYLNQTWGLLGFCLLSLETLTYVVHPTKVMKFTLRLPDFVALKLSYIVSLMRMFLPSSFPWGWWFLTHLLSSFIIFLVSRVGVNIIG